MDQLQVKTIVRNKLISYKEWVKANKEYVEGLEEERCPECNGAGTYDCPHCGDGTITCNNCDGSGYYGPSPKDEYDKQLAKDVERILKIIRQDTRFRLRFLGKDADKILTEDPSTSDKPEKISVAVE